MSPSRISNVQQNVELKLVLDSIYVQAIYLCLPRYPLTQSLARSLAHTYPKEVLCIVETKPT